MKKSACVCIYCTPEQKVRDQIFNFKRLERKSWKSVRNNCSWKNLKMVFLFLSRLRSTCLVVWKLVWRVGQNAWKEARHRDTWWMIQTPPWWHTNQEGILRYRFVSSSFYFFLLYFCLLFDFVYSLRKLDSLCSGRWLILKSRGKQF